MISFPTSPSLKPLVPCGPGCKGSLVVAFRRLWTVASFCFRSCSSKASLE
jgi:hypothetical protein